MLFVLKDNFFLQKDQLQIENSGFMKTCDEYVHSSQALATLRLKTLFDQESYGQKLCLEYRDVRKSPGNDLESH